jgi:hypothetical protein
MFAAYHNLLFINEFISTIFFSKKNQQIYFAERTDNNQYSFLVFLQTYS